MTKPSSSPDRHIFGKNSRKLRIMEQDGPETDKQLDDLEAVFKSIEQQKQEQEADPEWQQNNLEWDLRTTPWILEKVRASDRYAQNLYAALCNNDFCQTGSFELLRDERWSCSWRYAGGIVADMMESGDYIDWYCSGIRGLESDTPDPSGYVSESIVTDEIRADLERLGWLVVTDD